MENNNLRSRDICLIVFVGTLLFGWSLFGGRPLTLHEGRLPQSSREMMLTGDWLTPQNGGRPWLERPPLPHWIVIAWSSLVGDIDNIWVIRFPSMVMGILIALMIANMAARWYGRGVGLLSGVLLCTMPQFVMYSWLAEEDIYLAAVISAALWLFAKNEVGIDPEEKVGTHLLGIRSWRVVALFVLLGLTHLIKGPLFGMTLALIPMIGFLFWNLDMRRVVRYAWLWGGLIILAVGLWWYLVIEHRHPGAFEIWKYDLLGRVSRGHQGRPWWYYFSMMPQFFGLWLLPALLGLLWIKDAAFQNRYSPERFLFSWAVLPILVLSIPDGKHHHYMVANMAPWAILGALALKRLARHPRISEKWGKFSLVAVIGIIIPIYWFVFSILAPRTDHCVQDTEFFLSVPQRMNEDIPLYVDGDLGQPLETFRILYYLPEDTGLVHDLEYLFGDSITSRIYLITRAHKEKELKKFGKVNRLAGSEYTRRERSPMDRLTLFHLVFRPDIIRKEMPPVTPMQAMFREPIKW